MKKIGILGGGQLARLLINAGQAHGYSIRALCQTDKDPAFSLSRHNVLGALNDPKALQHFYEQSDIVSFESEFIDTKLLRKITGAAEKTFPSLDIIEKLRDRKTQKILLEQFHLATNPSTTAMEASEFEQIFDLCKNGLVAKKRTHGYDGYGTFVMKDRRSAVEFLGQNLSQLQEFIYEPLLQFKRELAVMVYRNLSGQTGSTPWVEWRAKDSKCWWVKGPIRDKRFLNMTKSLERFLTKIDYVGVMAFEFFDVKSHLIINEIAPRVHNSMHHSLDSLEYSQFELHLMCLLDQRLPKSAKSLTPGFSMVNLIGSETSPSPDLMRHTSGQLYWYQKTENRPGRKMGHVNAIGQTPEAALKLALKGAHQCQL